MPYRVTISLQFIVVERSVIVICKSVKMWASQFFMAFAGIFVVFNYSATEGRILQRREAVEELLKGRISRSLISNWICLMENESGMDTNLITGPKAAASFSYGVFQINSNKYCRRGTTGGICNAKCENFADDDISDDVQCAKKIFYTEGFQYSNGWIKKCKNQPLPDISCYLRNR